MEAFLFSINRNHVLVSNINGVADDYKYNACKANAVVNFLFLFCREIAATTGSKSIAADGSQIVSIIQLIATPEKYHGQKITVTGYATFEFEQNSICLLESRMSASECLWIRLESPNALTAANDLSQPNDSVSALNRFNKRVILVRGLFDMNNHGHLGLYTGAIDQITQVIIVR